IEKLGDDNYSEWHLDLYGWMLEHGLSNFITDKTPTPPSVIDEEKYDLFCAKRERAVGVIIQRLDKSAKIRFLNPETIANPNLLWKTIAEHYQSSEASNQARTFMNFLRIVYVTLPQYITDTRQGLSKMKNCGCESKIDESFLAEIIVSKFPEDLDTARERLTKKRPLEVKTVLDSLDKHKIEADERKKKTDAIAL
ncbi:hypothetical protein CROQUDRAFT_27060, partial [Cronartium quercuum f. sp. fusiforme G11]